VRVQESVQPDILTLGSIGSKVWEPLVPRTGIPWFQDWEELVHFLELGTRGSKIVKHWFERGGTSSSSNAEPVVLILIGTHWFHCLGSAIAATHSHGIKKGF